MTKTLKGLFHPACLARVVSWFAFVVAVFMGHENGDKQRLVKRRHVQRMLDETDSLISSKGPPPLGFHPRHFHCTCFCQSTSVGNFLRNLGTVGTHEDISQKIIF